jgi:Fe-S cluster assembly protein SufD
VKPTLAIDDIRAAMERMPGRTHEDWKYTSLEDVSRIINEWLAAGANVSSVPDAAVTAITTQYAADWLVIRNGVVDTASLANVTQAGLHIAVLSAGDLDNDQSTPLSDLNFALLQDGLTLQVAAGTTINRTLGLLFIDDTAADVGVSQARVNIELQAGSAANFIEYHSSVGAARHYANTVVELTMANAARCDYVRIQDRSNAHSQTGHLTATLANDSQFQHAAFDLGGDLVRNDLHIKLAGAGSAASFHGLYLAGESQHMDNHTRVDHLVGPASSRQEYRGILTDAAHCVWNGKAVVHVGADGTDASQANHNLLLSNKAEIDAKPELEIYTDDVKASHGTTIGDLDKNALFYLRTRGLDEGSARQLLMRAFAQKIVTLCPLESIRETLSEKIALRVTALIAGSTI